MRYTATAAAASFWIMLGSSAVLHRNYLYISCSSKYDGSNRP
jgi:hypothetical protein